MKQAKALEKYHEWVSVRSARPSKQSLYIKDGAFNYRVEYLKPFDPSAKAGSLMSGKYHLWGKIRSSLIDPRHPERPVPVLSLAVSNEAAEKAGLSKDEIDRNIADAGGAQRVEFFVYESPFPMLTDGFTALVPKELEVTLKPKVKAWFKSKFPPDGIPDFP